MNDTMMIRNPQTNEWEPVYLPPTGDTFPIGAYAFIAGEQTPTNWLRCDGQAVSRTEYADLFNVIGTTYGAGDGSTTFNLPNVNLENRTLVGSSGDGEFALGNTMGEKEHTLTVNELPKHKPSILLNTNDSNVSGSAVNYQATTKGRFYSSDTFQNIGGGQSHNNMQPSIAAICIIKAKQSVGIVGNKADTINSQDDNAWVNAKTIKNYVDGKNIFLKDEIVIGKWIDGKPLYRKMITFSDLRTDVYIQVEVAENALIRKYEGYIQRAGGASLDNLSLAVRNSKKIEYKIDSIYSNNLTGAYVIVYYTKSTD